MALSDKDIKIANRDYEVRKNKKGQLGVFRKDGIEPEDDILLDVLREKFREQAAYEDE